MTNILHVTASIRSGESVSRKLGNQLVEKIGQGTDASIVTRDLAANDLPLIDADRFAANLTPPAERDEKQEGFLHGRNSFRGLEGRWREKSISR